MSMKWTYSTPGIPDGLFQRGQVPMTKEEVRVLTLCKLRIMEDDTIVDIGAGTGSLSIEGALIARRGKVFSVEKNDAAVRLIRANAASFGIDNLTIIEGEAPEALKALPSVHKAIVGGSGRGFEGIMDWLDTNLAREGRVVITAITIEKVYRALMALKNRNYVDVEVVQCAISKGTPERAQTLMKAHNPVYIIAGSRGMP
jgi:precorrin-6Y C5,15-methyltransferase (decarboxylating) CbiT subunit